jgi:hypothetical protein
MARALRFDGDMRVEDITRAARFRNPNVLWSGNFLSSNGALPATTIVVAKGGTELTADAKQKFLAASKHEIPLPNGQVVPPTTTPLRLADGAEGFSYLAGFGPGGTSYAAVVTTPDGKYDIAIGMGFAAESANQNTPQSSENNASLSRASDVVATLESALRTIYPTVTHNMSFTLAELTPSAPAAVFSPPETKTVSETPATHTPSAGNETDENPLLKIGILGALGACVAVAVICFLRWRK